MNFKQIICEAAGKNWGWCDYYWDTVLVCKETNLLAVPDCPLKEERRLLKRDVPATACAVHKPIPPLPKWIICSATGREATRWCPVTEIVYEEPKLACRFHRPPDPKIPADFVLFSMDIFCRADFSIDEVRGFASRVGKVGVKYVRGFLGWDPDKGLREMPFLPAGATKMPVDVYKINPEWVKLLQRWQRELAKCGVGIIKDFYGQQVCRPSYPWAWFAEGHNINGIKSCYDTSPAAMKFWKWMVKQVFDIIGVEGNLMHLGNEQQAPGDFGPDNSDLNRLKEWARDWAVPLATYVRDELKVPTPILCTGEPYAGTGHKIANRLIEEAGWPEEQVCNDLHGLTMWEPFELWYKPGTAERKFSTRKRYQISDDGASFCPENTPPPEKRGICSHRLDGSTKCSCNQFWRIDTAKKIRKVFDDNLRFIEWMPQEFKGYRNPETKEWWRPGDLNQEISVDVYWKCAEALWGIDIRRDL